MPALTSARAMGLARILLGSLLLLRTTPLLRLFGLPREGYLQSDFPLLGWPSGRWHVAAFGLTLPIGIVAGLCIARTLATVAFLVGARSREAGTVAAVTGWIVLSQDALSYTNTLHLLFLGAAFLALGGAGSALAICPETVGDPSSGVMLVRALVVSVYAWGGLAKLNRSWMTGDALAQFHDYGIVRGPLVEAMLSTSGSRIAASGLVAGVELALGPLLLLRRTRRLALVLAVALHGALEVTVHPDFFGFAMVALLLAFVRSN